MLALAAWSLQLHQLLDHLTLLQLPVCLVTLL